MKNCILISTLAALACLAVPAHCAPPLNPAQPLVDGALKDFEAKKFDEAIKKLLEAEKLDPNSPFLLNLIGAAYTKKDDFTTAKSYFEKAIGIDYRYFPAVFNIGETAFLQKQYPQALEYFSRMLSADPGNELLQFKVVLCLILTDQPEEAKKLVSRMKVPGDGPAWYFAQAALKIQGGDKNKALDMLSNARTIFPDKIAIYQETFEDLGWPTK